MRKGSSIEVRHRDKKGNWKANKDCFVENILLALIHSIQFYPLMLP